MLGSLGAVRLLSMLRRELRFVSPFMALADAVSERLMVEGMNPSTFAVRDCTDGLGELNPGRGCLLSRVLDQRTSQLTARLRPRTADSPIPTIRAVPLT
jgi:hypothetical protein